MPDLKIKHAFYLAIRMVAYILAHVYLNLVETGMMTIKLSMNAVFKKFILLRYFILR